MFEECIQIKEKNENAEVTTNSTTEAEGGQCSKLEEVDFVSAESSASEMQVILRCWQKAIFFLF